MGSKVSESPDTIATLSEEPVPSTSSISKSGVYTEEADAEGGSVGASLVTTIALAYGVNPKPADHTLIER